MTNQPVKLTARILAAVTLLAGAFPVVGEAFLNLDWTTAQLGGYILGANAIIGSAGLVAGVQVAKVVTPTANPRDDAGNPLTPGPIASDDPEALSPPNMP